MTQNQERFAPRFHFCSSGNHYHLVTGLEFGASPAFASFKSGEFLVGVAVDPNNKQDVDDANRLKRELRELKLRHGRRRGTLYARPLDWEQHAIPHWSDLLRGTLRPSQIGAFFYFTGTPCDFVEKTSQKSSDEVRISLRAKKVKEVIS